uniref:Coiled-coil domain-containing protein 16 n=1 Tax=Strongyloides venezuelensis TaxID=75913 RepID=A0A0K0EYJ7_STRVS
MTTTALPSFAVAKENGFIECKICNKSDIREKLWISHVKGAEHRKSLLKLKEFKKSGEKRPHQGSSNDSSAIKKSKSDGGEKEIVDNVTDKSDNNASSIPEDFFEVSSAKPTIVIPQTGTIKPENEEEKAKKEKFLSNYDSIMEEFEEELKKDQNQHIEIDEEIEVAPERKDEDDIEEILGDAINTGTEEEMMKLWKDHEEVEKEIEENRKNGKYEGDEDDEYNFDEEDFKECDLFRGRSLF